MGARTYHLWSVLAPWGCQLADDRGDVARESQEPSSAEGEGEGEGDGPLGVRQVVDEAAQGFWRDYNWIWEMEGSGTGLSDDIFEGEVS